MDYVNIRNLCSYTSQLTNQLIDNFLIYYAARQDKIDKEAEQKIKPYRHITRDQDPGWVNFIMTQYIAFRIFKKGGLIGNYLTHSALKIFSAEEMAYLRDQSRNPWRFCFSEITGNPSEDFYEMEDILSGENFLLYSPGTTDILHLGSRTLWFNLIAFNGLCWQTFGPINGYKSFTADDIFFYATELNPALQNEADIIRHIESNPVPYMMLFSGSELPVIVNKNEPIVFKQAELNMPLPAIQNLNKDFNAEVAGHVTQYSLKHWNGFPHFARFYHDSQKKILQLHAMTEKGFAMLTTKMKAAGIPVFSDEDLSLTPNMLNTAESILKKHIELDKYGTLFQKETSPVDKEQTDQLNQLIAMIVPDINAGKEPDIKRLSKESGFDERTIKDLVAQIQNTVGRIRK